MYITLITFRKKENKRMKNCGQSTFSKVRSNCDFVPPCALLAWTRHIESNSKFVYCAAPHLALNKGQKQDT